jgi:hypothetical protein
MCTVLLCTPLRTSAAQSTTFVESTWSESKPLSEDHQVQTTDVQTGESDSTIDQSATPTTTSDVSSAVDVTLPVSAQTSRTGNSPTKLALASTVLPTRTSEGTLVGTLSSVDADVGDTVTYSLVAGTGDTDNSTFRLEGTNNEEVRTNSVLEYYAKSRFSIRVAATDGSGNTIQSHFVILMKRGNAYFTTNKSTIEVRFDEPVTPVNADTLKSAVRISVTSASDVESIRAMTRVDSVSITGATMRIRLGTALTGKKFHVKINAGTIQDAALNKNAVITTDSFATDTDTPIVTGITLSADNKDIVLTYSETLRSELIWSARLITLGELASDGVSAPTMRVAPPGSSVRISGKTVTVRLTEPLRGSLNFVRLAMGLVSDEAGNKSPAQDSQVVVADDAPPTVLSTVVSADAKRIIVTYDEPVLFKTRSGVKVYLANDGVNYVLLPRVNSTVLGNKLTISFTTPLAGALNRIRIGAETMVDTARNESIEYTSDALAVDSTSPNLVSAGLGESNSIIVLRFDEPVTATMATIKKKITLDRDTTDGNPGFDLTAADFVLLDGKVLTIELNTPLTGIANRLTIDAETFADAMNNKSALLTYDAFAVDTTAPTIASISVHPSNKIFVITFDEKILVKSRTTTPQIVAGYFSITTEGSEGTGPFSAFPTGSTATVSGKTVTLTTSKAYKGMTLAIRVRANVFTDMSKNANTLHTSPMFMSDVEAPW